MKQYFIISIFYSTLFCLFQAFLESIHLSLFSYSWRFLPLILIGTIISGFLYLIIFRFHWKGSSILFPLFVTFIVIGVVYFLQKTHVFSITTWSANVTSLFIFIHALQFTADYYRKEQITYDKIGTSTGNGG
ncbi:hypothetical protein D3873_06520 [Paenisporosarcina cavernae]|uniref:Uncharacterized protein n=1 Tax=Paenisporosarcina cavernae TaxID=2320858 RepID=A0A385YVF9_9BACL|nr:hypothetical protein D3873_06520 [Paenisporosarcina cavernae]